VQLVARQAQKVDTAFRKIYGNFTYGLDGIGVKDDAFTRYHFCNFFSGEYGSGFVVGGHYRNNGGLVVELIFKFGQIEPAFFVHADFNERITLILKLPTD
jgi:hypothetical protein